MQVKSAMVMILHFCSYGGEKPFMCNHCPLTFSNNDSKVLRHHAKVLCECLFLIVVIESIQ